MLFDPVGKCFEEVGHFEGNCKFYGCVALPDGNLVCAPCCSHGTLTLYHAAWHAEVHPAKVEAQACSTTQRLWQDKDFTDAIIIAGYGTDSQRSIPVHRAVLASKSEVFKRMFAGNFAEAATANVSLPEPAEVVEALLEYLYTGILPSEADPTAVLPLAHCFGLKECIAACALACDACDVAKAVRALRPLLEEGSPAVKAAWARTKLRIQRDPVLLEKVLLGLHDEIAPQPQFDKQVAHVAVQTGPEIHLGGRHSDMSRGGDRDDDQGSNTDPDDFHDAGDDDHSEPSKQHLGATPPGGPPSMGAGSSGGPPATSMHRFDAVGSVACFDRIHDAFARKLELSDMGQHALQHGSPLRPTWGNGATILWPGLTAEMLEESGVDLADLRSWHVVLRTDEVPRLRRVLLEAFPRCQRPRERASKERRFMLSSASLPSALIAQAYTSGAGEETREQLDSTVERVAHTSAAGEASNADEQSKLPSICEENCEEMQRETGSSSAGLQGEVGDQLLLLDDTDAPASIDKETAAHIDRARVESFKEARLWEAELYPLMRVHNTFVDCPLPPPPGLHSPRSVFTAPPRFAGGEQ